MKRNKKAQAQDILYIMVIIFILAITLITTKLWLGDVANQFSKSDTLSKKYTIDLVNARNDRFIPAWDKSFGFVVIGLSLFIFISAMFINSHPAFFWITWLFLVVIGFVNIILANVFHKIGSSPALSNVTQSFTIVPFVMQWYPLIFAAIGLTFAVVLHAKGGKQLF